MVHYVLNIANALFAQTKKGLFASSIVLGLAGCVGDAVDDGVPLEFGVGFGDQYRVLEDGDSCDVVYASQGGYFVMLRVRSDIPAQSVITCNLDIEEDSIAGQNVRLLKGDDASIGQIIFPIFPGHPERVGEIDGLAGHVYCDFEDQHTEVFLTMAVTYAEDLPEGVLGLDQTLENIPTVNGDYEASNTPEPLP